MGDREGLWNEDEDEDKRERDDRSKFREPWLRHCVSVFSWDIFRIINVINLMEVKHSPLCGNECNIQPFSSLSSTLLRSDIKLYCVMMYQKPSPRILHAGAKAAWPRCGLNPFLREVHSSGMAMKKCDITFISDGWWLDDENNETKEKLENVPMECSETRKHMYLVFARKMNYQASVHYQQSWDDVIEKLPLQRYWQRKAHKLNMAGRLITVMI